jgi:gas vesicle protein
METSIMTDQTFTDQRGSVAEPLKKAATTPKSVADQALSAGRDLKEKAIDLAGSSSDAIKNHAADLVDAAKDVTSQASDKLKQTVDDQKNAGAEFIGSVADRMRRAAREFDTELPIAGSYIRKAAAQVEGVSDSLRSGNFTDLVRGAQSFARRQPTAFLGISVLAGFAIVRFLKSSADSTAGFRQGGLANVSGKKANQSYGVDNGYRDDYTK